VLKSLTYFNDAEEQSDPIVFEKSLDWKSVKETIESEVKKIYK
jgi:hypothetical protein